MSHCRNADGFAISGYYRFKVGLDLFHISYVLAAHTKCCYVFRIVDTGRVGGVKLRRQCTLLAHKTKHDGDLEAGVVARVTV